MPPLIPDTNTLDPRILNSLSEPSLMAKSLNALLKPLSTVGTVLDTPASLIRAGIHGDINRGFRGLLSPEERVSGSELLGYNPNRFTWSGLGVELLADPLNFVSGGLTTAGKTAARASRLTKSAEVLKALNKADIPFYTRQLQDVQNALEGLSSKNLLGSTLAEQARSGQRAIKIGLPFTEGIPVLKAEGLYKGLDKINEGFSWLGKTAPVAAIGEKFVPQYGASDTTKEIIRQARAYTAERSAYGLMKQKKYYEAVADIAKDTGKTTDEINREFLDYAEYGSQSLTDSFADVKRNSTILDVRARVSPKIKDIYNSLDKDIQDLLRQGNERGLFLEKYNADIGYFPRQLSFEGRKFIEKLAKKHGVKLGEDAFDDAFGVLERIPSFTKMRQRFRDISTTQANDYVKKKFDVKFNLFDEDVGNLIASRIARQADDEAKRIALNASALLEGTKAGKGNVSIAKLLANRKGQQAFTSRFYTGRKKYSKYRQGAVLDKDGKTVAIQTADSRKYAAKQLRKLRKYNNSDWGTFIRAVYNTPEKRADFVDRIIEHFRERGDDIMGRIQSGPYVADSSMDYLFEQFAKQYDGIKDLNDKVHELDNPFNLLNTEISNIFGYRRTIPKTLNTKNILFHGTAQPNLELIRGSGLKGGVQSPNWPSSKLAKEGLGYDPRSVVFGPNRKDAQSYSYADRTPGDTESRPVNFAKFINNKLQELALKYNLSSNNGTYDLANLRATLVQGLDTNAIKPYNLAKDQAANLAKEINDFYKTYTKGQTMLTTKVSDLLKNITTTTDEALIKAPDAHDVLVKIYPDILKTGPNPDQLILKHKLEDLLEILRNPESLSSDSDIISQLTDLRWKNVLKEIPISDQDRVRKLIEEAASVQEGVKEIKTTGPLINKNYNKLFDQIEHGTPFGLFPKLDGDLNNLPQVFAKGQVPKELLRQQFRVQSGEVTSYWEHISKEGNIDNIAGDKLQEFKDWFNGDSQYKGDVTSEIHRYLGELNKTYPGKKYTYEELQKVVKSILDDNFEETSWYKDLENQFTKEEDFENLFYIKQKLKQFSKDLNNPENQIGSVQDVINKVFTDDITDRQRGFLTAYGNALKYNEGYFSIPLAESKYVNLGKKVEGNEFIEITKRSKGVKGTTVKELKKTFEEMGLKDKSYLPADVYKHMSNFIVDIRHPEWVKSTINFIDKVNAIYRGLYTSIVPAYHVRNLISGAFMNQLAGMHNPAEYIASTKAYKNLSDEAIVELTGLGVLGRGQGAETAQIISGAKFNPHSWATKGMSLGYKASNEVDNINRYALYHWATKTKGLSKLEAADLVKKYHFDYSDLTTFEREVMRRSVLFYTFQRKNFPLMLKSLWTNPKFMMAYARATGKTNANLLEPYWMNDAFTVGESEEGNELKLSLGLPPADLDRYDPMYRGVERFGQLLFSQLNPLLTGPAEFITGKDLYFDRPAQGGLTERLIGLSPLARLGGIAQRTAEDPSKEALRSLFALNIREIPANQDELNDAYLLRTKLKNLVRGGDAKTSEVVTPLDTSDEADREQIQILNRYLQGLYK